MMPLTDSGHSQSRIAEADEGDDIGHNLTRTIEGIRSSKGKAGFSAVP
jgi:hypothetical protein